MTNDLKQCPFCGGAAHASLAAYASGATAHALCDGCGAAVLGYGRGERGLRDAVKRWNRRAERTCRMEAFLLGEFFTGRKHVTDMELSDEEIGKVLFELRDDTVIRCSACHFSVLYGADVTYTQTDDGAWSVDAVRSQINYCPHCGARVEEASDDADR